MIGLADVLTERIEIQTGEANVMGAYIARPAGDEPGAGVIVAHELFGAAPENLSTTI